MDLNPHGNVLDIGGARGKSFQRKDKNPYYILDLNNEKNRDNVVVGDITDPNLNLKEKYDVIITKDTFEHILNPWDAVNNVLELLNEDGFFICIVPFNWRFHPSPYDGYRFSHQGQKYLWEHKGKMKEISSGYIRYYSSVAGFWKNRCDHYPFASDGRHKECVCSFYIGQKNSKHSFDVKEIKGDFSLKHEKEPV